MERIGIYGGSFNPPHIGHIQAAQQAIRTLKLDKLLLIPAGIPPHKVMPGNTPPGRSGWKCCASLRWRRPWRSATSS